MEKKYVMATARLENKRIFVGMSGGVDSAVAALLLKRKGYNCVGVFMKNWEDDECQRQDFEDMRRVCQKINIPYHVWNFAPEYKKFVFNFFLKELRANRTPNPDILCNSQIKFGFFLKRCQRLKAMALATGHYARISNSHLVRPRDRHKDQTYFLYNIPRRTLNYLIFPLANLQKDEVRQIAQKADLPVWQKKDSTGICFIGEKKITEFLRRYLKDKKGEIKNSHGDVLGEHCGLHHYTIGQRHGLKIGGSGPYYVVQKNQKDNSLLVTNKQRDPLLYTDCCLVTKLNWLVNRVHMPLEAMVQIRYRQKTFRAKILVKNNGKKSQKFRCVEVLFQQPQRAVTPGQSAVFYNKDVVLGGGTII